MVSGPRRAGVAIYVAGAQAPARWTGGPGTSEDPAALQLFPSEYLVEELCYKWDAFGSVESLNALRGAVERVAAGCPRVGAAAPGLAAALGRGA